MDKTIASRILDRHKISYKLVEYEVDHEHLEARHVAETLGEDITMVYKTLVLRGDKNGVFVCVVAGDKEVDLKKAAKVSGNKKAAMIPLKELLPLTGYIRGGCTSIGMKKNYPVFLDQQSLDLSYIFISAGRRGLQIKLDPRDLIKVTNANTADLIVENDELIGQ